MRKLAVALVLLTLVLDIGCSRQLTVLPTETQPPGSTTSPEMTPVATSTVPPSTTAALSPTPTTTLPPTESPAPSASFYRMDNTHEVAVRPDGKELYVTGVDSPLLVVDLVSPGCPVVGEVDLPGREAQALAEMPHISFSTDGSHAYINRPIQRPLEANYDNSEASWGDFNKIIEIDTNSKQISRQFSLPYSFTPTAAVVPSLDGKWLYFTAADFPRKPSWHRQARFTDRGGGEFPGAPGYELHQVLQRREPALCYARLWLCAREKRI